MEEQAIGQLEQKVGALLGTLGRLREQRDEHHQRRTELETQLGALEEQNQQMQSQINQLRENNEGSAEASTQHQEIVRRVEGLLGRFDALGDLDSL